MASENAPRLRHVMPIQYWASGCWSTARDLIGPLTCVLFPSPACLRARYAGVGSSLLDYYLAHYQRLGQVMRQATRGLGPLHPRDGGRGSRALK